MKNFVYLQKLYLNMKKILILFVILCYNGIAYAQQTNTYTNSENLFYEGKILFSQKKYAASSLCFENYLKTSDKKFSETEQESHYFIAANAFELRKENAIYLLKDYLKKYPYTSFFDQSCFMIGTLEFEQRNFKEATLWIGKVNPEKLTNEERIDYYFRNGYTMLQVKNYAGSKYMFLQLIGKNTKYETAATYYYAYAEYTQKNYDTALEGFLKVKDNPEYSDFVPYYVVQIYYHKQRYEELIPIAESLIAKNPKNQNNNEIYRILGECYYQKKNYAKTIEFLNQYHKSVKKVVRNDMYLLGISYFNVKNYQECVTFLSKVTTQEDPISQSAYLYLGHSYLKQDLKKNARFAFEQASNMSYDKDLKEEALYNYALCTYEMSFSPFNESILAFEAFLKEFPKSKYTDKVYDYLVNVYLTTNNYEAAYQSMINIQSPGPRIQEAKQRVLYNMGVDALTANKHEKAIELFSSSLKLSSYNSNIAAMCRYWRADAYYKMDKFALAREDYNSFLLSPGARLAKEFNLANYNVGYTYFNEKEYENALVAFRRFVSSEANKKSRPYNDALNRIGDCYFVKRDLSGAFKYYSEAANTKTIGTDYSIFQKAIVMGLLKDYRGKISTMQELTKEFPSSEYKDDAIYEIGHAYVMLDENEKAIDVYDKLYKEFPTSSLAKKGLLQKGMLLYNKNEYDNAILTYKQVIVSYPNSEEASTALEGLEKIHVQTNRVHEYTAYTQTLGNNIKITIEKEDSLNYAAAERQYLYGNTKEATISFDNYLKKFPRGNYNVKARYYLADSYYMLGDKTQALNEYKIILEQIGNPHTEEALARAAEISYDNKEFADALSYFSLLKTTAEKKENIAAAKLGVLRCNDFLNNPNGTIAAANEMMQDKRLDIELVREARYRRAKAYLSINDNQNALNDLTELSYETRHVYGAECNYLLANYFFTINEYEKAEKVIFTFIEKNTPHQYWLARCFILLSDIYIKQNDDFQAKQYLLSLRENYKVLDSIQDMIFERMSEIENREKQSIITTEEEEISE